MYKILILDEGSQGHIVQSRGFVREISKQVEVECTELVIPRRLPRKLTRALGKRILKSSFWRAGMELLHGRPECFSEGVDLIVSSGPHSLNFLRYLGMLLKRPTVFVQGTLEVEQGQVDLIVRPNDGVDRADIIHIPLLFTDITVASIEALRPATLAKYGMTEKEVVYACFVGNSSGKIRFSDSDWIRLAEGMNQVWRSTGVQWLLSTSYRTGRKIERLLMKHLDPQSLKKAVWFSNNPERVTREYLAIAQKVYISADSLTMVTEAIAAGRPCYIFQPEKAGSLTNSHVKYMDSLVRQNLARDENIFEVKEDEPPQVPKEIDYSTATRAVVEYLNWN